MNRKLVLVATALWMNVALASATPPADINVKESNAAINVLSGSTEENRKPGMAQTMEAHLGNYNPPAIIWLGNYYLSKKNYEKAALYFHLGILRASIDIKASHDPALKDVVPTLINWIQKGLERNLTPEDRQKFAEIYKSESKQVIKMDQQLPRNYDNRWASVHSKNPLNYADTTEYKKIIEQEYQDFKAKAKQEGITVE